VLRQSSSQLQYMAAQSKSAVKHTQRYDGAIHKFEKMAAQMCRRIAVEQIRYAAGMADTQGWQFETFCRPTSLHKNLKCA